MRRRRRAHPIRHSTIAVLGLAVGLVGACGPAPGETDPSSDAPSDFARLSYTCTSFPVTAEHLAAPARHDEDADTAVAAALREGLARLGGLAAFPKSGWTLAWETDHAVEFIRVGGDLSLKMVHVDDASGPWNVGGWGDCLPQLVLADGLGPATWQWGSAGLPSRETMAFDALVTESACASGQSADGRIVGPKVIRAPEVVFVIFGVRALTGDQECPGNPSTRVPVDIGEPLGDRELLDGGALRLSIHGSPAPVPNR